MTEAAPAAAVAPAAVGGNLYRLVEQAYAKRHADTSSLPATPVEFIQQQRARDDGSRAFRLIANDLTALTGVDVTHETVRRWYREYRQEPDADTPES